METDQGRIINNLKGSNRKNIEMEEIGHRCVHRTECQCPNGLFKNVIQKCVCNVCICVHSVNG